MFFYRQETILQATRIKKTGASSIIPFVLLNDAPVVLRLARLCSRYVLRQPWPAR